MKMTSLGDLHPWVGLTSPSRVSSWTGGAHDIKTLKYHG